MRLQKSAVQLKKELRVPGRESWGKLEGQPRLKGTNLKTRTQRLRGTGRGRGVLAVLNGDSADRTGEQCEKGRVESQLLKIHLSAESLVDHVGGKQGVENANCNSLTK